MHFVEYRSSRPAQKVPHMGGKKGNNAAGPVRLQRLFYLFLFFRPIFKSGQNTFKARGYLIFKNMFLTPANYPSHKNPKSPRQATGEPSSERFMFSFVFVSVLSSVLVPVFPSFLVPVFPVVLVFSLLLVPVFSVVLVLF